MTAEDARTLDLLKALKALTTLEGDLPDAVKFTADWLTAELGLGFVLDPLEARRILPPSPDAIASAVKAERERIAAEVKTFMMGRSLEGDVLAAIYRENAE